MKMIARQFSLIADVYDERRLIIQEEDRWRMGAEVKG